MNDQSGWADHLEYEWRMLRWAYRERTLRQRGTDGYRAAIECYLLHYRNLVEFLQGPKSGIRDDDLTAKLYAGRLFPVQHADLTKVHKYLAHLTKTRSEPAGWDLDDMLDGLEETWMVFVRSVEDDHLAARLGSVMPTPRLRLPGIWATSDSFEPPGG